MKSFFLGAFLFGGLGRWGWGWRRESEKNPALFETFPDSAKTVYLGIYMTGLGGGRGNG